MKIFISATERSADLHAFHLILSLRKITSNLTCSGVMGDLNSSENIWVHNNQLNVMGFSDVLPKIPKILGILSFLEKKIKEEKPDVIVCIDSPDFNFRLIKRIYKEGIPIIYYICPQVWAWRKKRIFFLQKYCQEIIPILPFEKKIYSDQGIKAQYLGHPIMDEQVFDKASKKEFVEKYNLPKNVLEKKWVGIFPGSRSGEISRHLAILEDFVRSFSDDHLFLVASVNKLNLQWPNTYELPGIGEALFSVVDKALVKSGTSSLQAALFGVPSIVFYKVTLLNKIIFKMFIRYKGFVSLPNLILEKEVFPEMLQEKFNVENLKINFYKLPQNINNERDELIQKLGGKGCSDRVARMLVDVSKNSRN